MDNGGQFTDALFADANIRRGSRGLDVGCGVGEVTLRLAKAVGAVGEVLGIDPNAAALEKARISALDHRLENVSFHEGDLCGFVELGEQFDVITCRRVLMYLADQSAAARAFKELLKPGGLLIIQEHDTSVLHSTASVPLYERARAWVWETVAAEGANLGTGFDLHGLLSQAGFSQIEIRATAVVETPSQTSLLADIVAAMLPRIEAAGVATADEVDAATLADRLAAERHTNGGTSVGELIFGALARS